jgi:translation initiation factor 4E
MAGEEVTSYPLNTSWGIWELREQGKNSSYSDKLYKLCSFSTVEEFWGYWNHIPKPR